MVNLLAPTAVIFVNNDLTDNVKAAIQRQLFINDTMDGTEFDSRLTVDPNYVNNVHSNGLRILVIRSFLETTNRDKADLVLFVKAGLASVLESKFGPPGQTFPVNSMYLSQIMFTM